MAMFFWVDRRACPMQHWAVRGDQMDAADLVRSSIGRFLRGRARGTPKRRSVQSG